MKIVNSGIICSNQESSAEGASENFKPNIRPNYGPLFKKNEAMKKLVARRATNSEELVARLKS